MGEGKQTGAIKRGYNHKRQFYIPVITLKGLSDIRAKSGKAKLMLLKLAYLNINEVLSKERSFHRLRRNNKRASSNQYDRNMHCSCSPVMDFHSKGEMILLCKIGLLVTISTTQH